jgi:molybdate transport system ATP-binding protein
MVGIETVADGEVVDDTDGLVVVRIGETRLLAVAPSPKSRWVHVCIKGEDVALQRHLSESTSVRNHLTARVKSLTPEGPLVRVGLDCGFELTSLITRPAHDELRLMVGDVVVAMLKAPAIHLIPCPEKS